MACSTDYVRPRATHFDLNLGLHLYLNLDLNSGLNLALSPNLNLNLNLDLVLDQPSSRSSKLARTLTLAVPSDPQAALRRLSPR
jgi:hypothetical protein